MTSAHPLNYTDLAEGDILSRIDGEPTWIIVAADHGRNVSTITTRPLPGATTLNGEPLTRNETSEGWNGTTTTGWTAHEHALNVEYLQARHDADQRTPEEEAIRAHTTY